MAVGLATYKNKFFEPVDNTPLVLFRAAFGFLLAAEGFGAIMTGWVKANFIVPEYHFPFIAFDWIQPLPGNWMYLYFVGLGFFGLLIMLGLYYRAAAIGYFLLWTGAYLMQKTSYNNHYYLMVLFTFIIVFLPANKNFSLDVKLGLTKKSSYCIRGIMWIFILQSAVFYIYASVAKWNPDWIGFRSVEMLFSGKLDYPIVGSLLSQKWFQILIAGGGIVFDFFIVPILLWKRTRMYGLIAALFFHLFNSVIFQIGIFPYMALALIIFFYSGEELRYYASKIRIKIPQYELKTLKLSKNNQNLIIFLFSFWFLIQILLPIRHHFIEGDVNWTEEGHRMSWRMMLRSKSGYVNFKVIDSKENRIRMISPIDYVTPKQAHRVAVRPDFCWQFVQILKKDFGNDVKIYADGKVSLNGSPMMRLYKKDYDLSNVEWDTYSHAEWLNLNNKLESNSM